MVVCLCARPTGDGWATILAVLPDDLVVVWDETVAAIEEDTQLHPDRPVRNGQILEILCANYLAR